MTETWYRVEDGDVYRHSKGLIQPRELQGARVWIRQFSVLRRTEKGVWLIAAGCVDLGEAFIKRHRKFVLNPGSEKNPGKRLAYPNLVMAYDSWCIRKMRQREHLISRLRDVDDYLELIDQNKDLKLPDTDTPIENNGVIHGDASIYLERKNGTDTG